MTIDQQSERNPFAEAVYASEDVTATTEAPSSYEASYTPFAEAAGMPVSESETDRMLMEAFAQLRDEAFDGAVAFLAEETEQAIADRFTDESPASAAERERYGDAQLSAVRFEAQQYLASLEAGLAGEHIDAMSEDQLGEALDRLDPQPGELTPAGEEFLGSLIKKAKSAVKFVAKAAKGVGSVVGKVAGTLLGPVLQKLRGLINPLLKRVLSIAIGRLPVALQPSARALAKQIASETWQEGGGAYEGVASPASLADPASLAESFDASLAEALVSDSANNFAGETYEDADREAPADGRALERLAEARGELIDRIRTARDEEDLAPAIEQFVPALLGALRLGIKLVGRPKVVQFLARYLGQVIRGWVGPTLTAPLSSAIVDTGLRLVQLETNDETGASRVDEAGPVALASVVEDTTRRLAESEEYIFDNEDLTQLATADAFGEAVATHFPQRFVRAALRQAPSLGGTFVARRPRSVRTYRKYSRTPEVEITAQVADALPTFGGTTVGAVLRAAGATFPVRARLHIYEAVAGTTLPRMLRVDRANGVSGHAASSQVHPLTPEAAGLLLHEPKLGVAAAPAFLQSRSRIAVGQRFYLIEPIGAAGALVLSEAAPRAAAARLAPSRAWTVVNLRRSKITVGLYFSEADAQGLAESIRQGRGPAALLQALSTLYRTSAQPSAAAPHGHLRLAHEDSEDNEELAPSAGHALPGHVVAILRRRVESWVLPALAAWVKDNSEAFARAAAHPDAGVTVRIRLTAVPGLDALAQATSAASAEAALRGTPSIAIGVASGKGRK